MRVKPCSFINCICTYLAHIYESLFLDDDYLFFLIDKLILCRKVQNQRNIQIENPWGFQPFIIGNQIEQKESMFEQLRLFLERESNIKLYEKEKLSLLKQIRNGDFCCILPVDEFYLSKSKFYNKKHNKHYVLVKRICKSEVLYFDSETMNEQNVEFKKLEQAVKSKLISECGYEVDVSEAKKMCFVNNELRNNYEIPYIKTAFYSSINNEDFFFFMEALRLSITFQIVPYLLMKIKYCEFDGLDLLYLYKQLTQYLLIGKIKKKIDKVVVITHLEKINLMGEINGKKIIC